MDGKIAFLQLKWTWTKSLRDKITIGWESHQFIFMIVIFIIKASAVVTVIEAVWFNYWQCETRDHTGCLWNHFIEFKHDRRHFQEACHILHHCSYIHTANNCNFVTSRTTSCQCGFQGHIIPLKMQKVAKPEIYKHYSWKYHRRWR